MLPKDLKYCTKFAKQNFDKWVPSLPLINRRFQGKCPALFGFFLTVHLEYKNTLGKNAPPLDTVEAKLNWIFSIYDADDGGRFQKF